MTHPLFPAPNPVPSYWLRDPSPLADLRSTPHLPTACDIAVVGAGLAGVLSAYHILTKLDEGRSGADGGADVEHGGEKVEAGAGKEEKRPSVVLLDARQLCSGATGRNGGHIKVQVRTLLDLPPPTAADGEDMEIGEKRTALQSYVHRVIAELKRIVDAASALSAPFVLETRDLGTRTVPVATAEAIYSAAVQAMMNSLQHAGTSAEAITRMLVISGHGDEGVAIDVVDDGAGFDQRRIPTERLGLRVSIKERVAQAGGLVTIESAPGEGTAGTLASAPAISSA